MNFPPPKKKHNLVFSGLAMYTARTCKRTLRTTSQRCLRILVQMTY